MTRDPIPLPLHHPPNNHGKLLGLKFLLSRFPSSTHSQSDSDTTRSTPSRSASSAVAKPPGAQIRYVSPSVFLLTTFFTFWLVCSRRAGTSQVSRPNSSRSAGAGGSSNTMLKLYTDDSPGLRVYVSLHPLFSPLLIPTTPLVTLSSSSSFHSPSSPPYSSSISPPKSSAPSPSNRLGGATGADMPYAEDNGEQCCHATTPIITRRDSRFSQTVHVTRYALFLGM